MKNLLTILFFLFFGTDLYGQTDSTAVQQFQKEFEKIESKKEDIQRSSESLKSSSEYQQQIKSLNQQLIQLNAGESDNSQEIQSIQDQIKTLESQFEKSIEREKKINELNNQLVKLNEELASFKKYRQLTEAEKQQTEELIQKTNEVNKDIIKNELSYLIGNVEGWKPLTADLTLLSNTAKSVLIFDEKTSKKLWNGIKKGGLDVLTIVAGALAVTNFDNGKNTEAYTAAGLGIGLKVLQSQMKENKIVESLTRNIAFSDEISAYASIAVPLDSTVSELFDDIPTTKSLRKKWFPSNENLNQYRKIIDYMEEIQFQNLMLKNKAHYLIDLGRTNENLSEGGKDLLQSLITYYDKSVSDWNRIEPLYLARYDVLLVELQRREKELLIGE